MLITYLKLPTRSSAPRQEVENLEDLDEAEVKCASEREAEGDLSASRMDMPTGMGWAQQKSSANLVNRLAELVFFLWCVTV